MKTYPIVLAVFSLFVVSCCSLYIYRYKYDYGTERYSLFSYKGSWTIEECLNKEKKYILSVEQFNDFIESSNVGTKMYRDYKRKEIYHIFLADLIKEGEKLGYFKDKTLKDFFFVEAVLENE